jgi:hypothetical protein
VGGEGQQPATVSGADANSMIVIANGREAIQSRKQSWIASAFTKKLRRTGRRKSSSQ